MKVLHNSLDYFHNCKDVLQHEKFIQNIVGRNCGDWQEIYSEDNTILPLSIKNNTLMNPKFLVCQKYDATKKLVLLLIKLKARCTIIEPMS